MMSATPGFGRFGSGLGADCFLAAAFPSTALPRPFSAPFTRPFILALACDLGPAILADTIRSFLPIHASRRLAYLSLGRQKPTRRSSRPVFNLLFFQVKELPCGATQMVAAAVPERVGRPLDARCGTHATHYYVVHCPKYARRSCTSPIPVRSAAPGPFCL